MDLNELYVIDDSAVIPILEQTLKEFKSLQTPGVQISDEMVTLAKSKFVRSMYQRIQNMVFTDDKIGAIAIFYKNVNPEAFNNKLFAYFTGQQLETTC